jgi:hypothetical protein
LRRKPAVELGGIDNLDGNSVKRARRLTDTAFVQEHWCEWQNMKQHSECKYPA